MVCPGMQNEGLGLSCALSELHHCGMGSLDSELAAVAAGLYALAMLKLGGFDSRQAFLLSREVSKADVAAWLLTNHFASGVLLVFAVAGGLRWGAGVPKDWGWWVVANLVIVGAGFVVVPPVLWLAAPVLAALFYLVGMFGLGDVDDRNVGRCVLRVGTSLAAVGGVGWYLGQAATKGTKDDETASSAQERIEDYFPVFVLGWG